MIYISTGGEKHKTFLETVKEYAESGMRAFELSGGKFCDSVEDGLLELSTLYDLQLHNYFPVPQDSFVFNLASLNSETSRSSLEHARRAVELTKKVGSNVFSFHAGFLIDPDVSELGKKIRARKLNDRREAMARFLENVNLLAPYAEQHGVDLLIENNVVSSGNYEEFGGDPLLMTAVEETLEVMEGTPRSVGLLVDVAHLKVSANTLGFEGRNFMVDVESYVRAYHLSDNNGLSDQNMAVTKDSWFWPYIDVNKNMTLEVYGATAPELMAQVELVEEIAG